MLALLFYLFSEENTFSYENDFLPLLKEIHCPYESKFYETINQEYDLLRVIDKLTKKINEKFAKENKINSKKLENQFNNTKKNIKFFLKEYIKLRNLVLSRLKNIDSSQEELKKFYLAHNEALISYLYEVLEKSLLKETNREIFYFFKKNSLMMIHYQSLFSLEKSMIKIKFLSVIKNLFFIKYEISDEEIIEIDNKKKSKKSNYIIKFNNLYYYVFKNFNDTKKEKSEDQMKNEFSFNHYEDFITNIKKIKKDDITFYYKDFFIFSLKYLINYECFFYDKFFDLNFLFHKNDLYYFWFDQMIFLKNIEKIHQKIFLLPMEFIEEESLENKKISDLKNELYRKIKIYFEENKIEDYYFNIIKEYIEKYLRKIDNENQKKFIILFKKILNKIYGLEKSDYFYPNHIFLKVIKNFSLQKSIDNILLETEVDVKNRKNKNYSHLKKDFLLMIHEHVIELIDLYIIRY